MRLNKFLKERFEIGFRFYGESFEIFTNPTKREFKEIGQDYPMIRFMANKKNKRVYIFRVRGYVHNQAWNELKKQGIEKGGGYYSEAKKGNILGGYCELKGGKWIILSSDTLESEPRTFSKIIKGDWSWVDKYVLVTDYIEKLRLKILKGFVGKGL